MPIWPSLNILSFAAQSCLYPFPSAGRAAQVQRLRESARMFISDLLDEDALKLTYAIKMTAVRRESATG